MSGAPVAGTLAGILPHETLFSAAGTLALVGWLLLAVVPLRWRWAERAAVGVALCIAAAYAALIGAHWVQRDGGFGSLAEVARLFQHPGLLLAGWVHYLAFDLLIGAWQRHEARRIGLHPVVLLPTLVLTFLLGPLGWGVFMGLRWHRLRSRPSAIAEAPPLPAWWRRLGGQSPPETHLLAAAGLSLALLVPVGLAAALDPRTLGGVSVWLKPAKFLLSFALYYATLAVVAALLPQAERRTRLGRWVVASAIGAGGLEMAWLLAAAAAGVPAHFATARGWAQLYPVAGVLAVVLILAILLQGWQVARQPRDSLAPALRHALVLGAVLAFGATLLAAGYLSGRTGHAVGGVPGAAGLPLVGWSRTGGDLRVAHFLALHAQQALPLLGLLLVAAGRPKAVVVVWLAAALWTGATAATFVQALRGSPLWPLA